MEGERGGRDGGEEGGTFNHHTVMGSHDSHMMYIRCK